MDFEAYNLYGAAERAGAAASCLLRALGADFRPDAEIASDEQVSSCLQQILEQLSVAKGCLHQIEVRPSLPEPSGLPLGGGRAYEYHKMFAHGVWHWASTTCVLYGSIDEGGDLYRCIFRGADPEPGADFPSPVKSPASISLFVSLLGFSSLLLRYRRQSGFPGVAPYREDWYVG